jgi:hypothetical protein
VGGNWTVQILGYHYSHCPKNGTGGDTEIEQPAKELNLLHFLLCDPGIHASLPLDLWMMHLKVSLDSHCPQMIEEQPGAVVFVPAYVAVHKLVDMGYLV